MYSRKNLILESTGRYPASLLRNKEHVIYIGWLMFNKVTRLAWDGIYNNLIY